ncbi:MAG: FxsA family protein, partial [Pseudomonadota bacterium]|nr:FxsA family protein [Pseudomonadota bacterium]
MLGARAIRRQGIDALARAQAQMANGKPPVGEIVHGVLILMAGIFLLTPGFMTDALGFLLLFPATRLFVLELAAGFILPKLFSGFSVRRGSTQNPADAKIIDGDYRVEDPDD